MATLRHRTRTRTRNRQLTSIKYPNGTQNSFAADAFVESEVMDDVTSPVWPRIEIVPADTEFPTRLGFPHGNPYNELSVAINPLAYSCTTVAEASSSFELRFNASNILTIDGCVNQGLNKYLASQYPSPTPPVMPSLAQLGYVVKSKVLQMSQDPEYAFGEPLAELKKTLVGLRNPFHTLRRIAKSFYKRRKTLEASARTAKQVSRAFAATYAEYQFALAPTVRSIQDGMDAHIDYMTRTVLSENWRAFRSKHKASGSSRATSVLGAAWSGGSPSGTFILTRENILFQEYDVRAGLYRSNPTDSSKREYLGLSARDIPVTLWELFPYSFLIDRLVNVKGFIKTSMALTQNSVRFGGGWLTERVTTRNAKRTLKIERSGWTAKPSSTFPFVTSVHTYSRFNWNPAMSPLKPPHQGKGLFNSLSSTLDLLTVATLRLTKGT